MSRKICIVTGTRAEFGLLRQLMHEIRKEPETELQILATGTHLSPEYGLTYREIELAGFVINEKVEMLLSADTPTSVTKSIGLGLISYADAFERLAPDVLVILGDRFEMLAVSAAALIAGIPIAHLHGGETTEGAFDEAIRHSITKMSHLHFVAAEPYRKRVIQLGEHPERVFLVGGLGIDAIKQTKLLDRNELEESLDFKFGPKNLLITFHPVTLERGSAGKQVKELLAALKELTNTNLIFTMPNADTGGREIFDIIRNYVANNSNAKVFVSLGQLRYLSCMRYVDGVVGNSSSGVAEAPSMGVGTIDIGDRQKGRCFASSIIHCDPELNSIRQALKKLYSVSFQSKLSETINPYGNGGASLRIAEILKRCSLNNLIKKTFFDL